jgi:hypothetical protein
LKDVEDPAEHEDYRCDYHPGFRQIAFVDTETGELQERRLQHREEAEKFYRDLAVLGMKVCVGMEASGHARWFERLLAELNFELWIGDATVIRAKRVRKQKTDRQDAQLILKLMLKDDFPRIWVPSGENRDLRQLLHACGCYSAQRFRSIRQNQSPITIDESQPEHPAKLINLSRLIGRDARCSLLVCAVRERFRLVPYSSFDVDCFIGIHGILLPPLDKAIRTPNPERASDCGRMTRTA